MHTHYYLGVMSGTSLDGVDLALVNFAKNGLEVPACRFTPMPEDLRADISALLKCGETSLQKLGEIDHRLALLYADCINAFLAEQHLKPEQIQAIGCHGQTVWHSPQGQYPFTTQIGDMNLVAAKTGITVVGDFRRKDMAYGGQGAPLVPAFHQAIFRDPHRITAVLNIGGISNVSLLVPNQPTLGYDIGPGNTLMDIWIEKHLGKRFDQDAEWAKTGVILGDLLDTLLDEAYFNQLPPKSTGRELFNQQWLDKKLSGFEHHQPQDIQATLAAFTAQSICNDLAKIPNPDNLPCLLLVCGGGARNPLLMRYLAEGLKDWQVSTTSEYGLNIDYVEAAAFAWLAHQRMNHLAGNLPSVTGATQAVSLGAIFPKE